MRIRTTDAEEIQERFERLDRRHDEQANHAKAQRRMAPSSGTPAKRGQGRRKRQPS